MTLEAVQAFLDAADDLLAGQQQLMTQPLSVELRALTEATLALRLEVLDGAGAAIAAGTTRGPEPRAAPTSPSKSRTLWFRGAAPR